MPRSPAPPSSPSAAARLRQLAQALRAQRRLAASGRPGYDLDDHRDLARAFRKEAGLACEPAPRERAPRRPHPQRPTRMSLRAQAEALFTRKT
jgi:hypothetical protein